MDAGPARTPLPSLRDWARWRDWVGWCSEQNPRNPKKFDKPPRVTLDRRVDVHHPETTTFLTLDEAEALLTQLRDTEPLAREAGAGVGIVLNTRSRSAHERLIGVDLDHCRDPATGEIAPWALEIIRRFDSYTEVSPSGTGVKIFLLAHSGMKLRGGKKLRGGTWRRPGADPDAPHEPGIELHVGGYFTVTWATLEVVPPPPDPAQPNRRPPREPDGIRHADELDLEWLIEVAGPAFAGETPGGDRPRRKRSQSSGRSQKPREQVDLEVLQDALRHIPADDYDVWIRVGLALHHDLGDAGLSLWTEWSESSDKFRDEKDLTSRWRGFRDSRDEPVTLGTVFKLAKDGGWTSPAGEAPSFSDEDLALRFAHAHEVHLRWTDAWGKWHYWDDTRWRQDDTLVALDLARAHCRVTASRASKGGARIASARAVSATHSLARADRRLTMQGEDWDQDPLLLATPGGTVDLRTGRLRPADQGDYITKCTAVAPGGDCPLWRQTLGQIFPDEPEKIDFLQVFGGYCLTGLVREEVLLFPYGGGSNGKDTAFDTIFQIMGDYATAVASSTLMEQRYQQHPAEIARLRGARLALSSEVEKGARWNIERVKLLTGGGVLTGRFMKQDWFDYRPTHKLVILGNDRPRLGHVDYAIRRRVVLLACLVQFDKTRADTKLKQRLVEAEGGGILAWQIEGARRYLRDGLQVPDSVQRETEQYLQEMDDLYLWIDECCALESDPVRRVTTAELYASYDTWRRRSSAAWISPKMFVGRLRKVAGIQVADTRSHSQTYVDGIRLLSPREELDRKEQQAEAARKQGNGTDGNGHHKPTQGEMDLGQDADDPL
jgi:putative DNA primase/helicase